AAGLAALDRIEELFARAEDSYDVERARYWRARVLDAQGQRPSAVAVWTSLARQHPSTYYGLLARARLAEREPAAALELAQGAVLPGPALQPTLVAAGSLLANPHYLAAVQLSALGQWETATQEL